MDTLECGESTFATVTCRSKFSCMLSGCVQVLQQNSLTRVRTDDGSWSRLWVHLGSWHWERWTGTEWTTRHDRSLKPGTCRANTVRTTHIPETHRGNTSLAASPRDRPYKPEGSVTGTDLKAGWKRETQEQEHSANSIHCCSVTVDEEA